ncbi:MAG: putative capsular polysaccharide synthesis family protein [Planctomycetota bacterium]
MSTHAAASQPTTGGRAMDEQPAASRVLVAGVPKSGTTALVYKLAEGLGDPILSFEPKNPEQVTAREALGEPGQGLLAKIVYTYHDQRPLHSLLHGGMGRFDATVWIARDPRDQIVSAFLYAFFRSHRVPERIFEIAQDMTKRKEAGEHIPLVEMMTACFGEKYYHHPEYYGERLTSCFREPSDDLVIFSYDDLIAKDFRALGDRLHLDLAGEAEVPGQLGRVKRSGGSGEWRRWFTPEDIEHFRPFLAEYMTLMGMDDDWELSDEPINPEYSSRYMEKIYRTPTERELKDGPAAAARPRVEPSWSGATWHEDNRPAQREHWADMLPPLGRHPRREMLLRRLSRASYELANPDLYGTFADADEARAHFERAGYAQRRLWRPDLLEHFDAAFYRRRYPELKLESDEAAARHFAFAGLLSDRFANAKTEFVWNARVHLFQMGKVGSKAIQAGISEATGEHCVHCHWADWWDRHNTEIRLPYSRLLAHKRDDPAIVISGLRDPFTRSVSGWFQEFTTLDRKRELMTVEQATREILARFRETGDRVTEWFDHRFYCDLDVYSAPFDVERGFGTLEHPWMRVFVYRQDTLPTLSDEIDGFLGNVGFELKPANVGGEKWYAEVYRSVTESLRFPTEEVERQLATAFMRHFYSEQQRDAFRERWTG